MEVEILESASRPGGTIGSEAKSGAVHEWGPNGWLAGDTATDRLTERLGLGGELLAADPVSARRYVVLDDDLVEIPASALAFVRSPLLSAKGKIRLLAEPFIGRPGPAADESVAEFGRRRLGMEAVEHILDPILTGIYAGDVDRTSMAAAFPTVRALERDHGSLLRGAMARRRKAETGAKRLVSLRGGMGDLVSALADAMGNRLKLDTTVRSIAPLRSGGFRIASESGPDRTADFVVAAVPAHVLADLCADFLPGASGAAREISYAPAAVIETVHRREGVRHSLDGFGFLCSRKSGRSILGTIWASSVFPGHRAPDGHVTLRTLVGGTRRPDLVGSPDVVDTVLAELDDLLGLSEAPRRTFIRRWSRAIPQYEVGHLERIRVIDDDVASVPGFCVIGNAFRGVSVNDCTAAAEQTAEKILCSA